MKKLIRYIIPFASLIIFIAVMLSGEYLKKPRNPSEDVIGLVEAAIKDTRKEDWNKIEQDIILLEKAWNKIVPRIQFSVERDEIYNIGINIARLKGSVISEDKSAILSELYALIENWNELTR